MYRPSDLPQLDQSQFPLWVFQELLEIARELQLLRNQRFVQVAAPAEHDSPGQIGQYALTEHYFYLCVAENSWVRIHFGAW
jgi:hypothetical protein